MSNDPYTDGYRQGNLSEAELKEANWTPETWKQHIRDEAMPSIYNHMITSDDKEFFYGLIDGASDSGQRR